MISAENLRRLFIGGVELDAATLANKCKRLTGEALPVSDLNTWLEKETEAGTLRMRISLKDPVEGSELKSFSDLVVYETFKKSQNPLRNSITGEVYSISEAIEQKHYRLVNAQYVYRGLVDVDKEHLRTSIILGCDTIGFSKELTSTQLTQFRNLTQILGHALNRAKFAADEVFAIPTGDGYFLIINDGEASRTLSFLSSLNDEIRKTNQHLPLRIGLHSGTAYLVQTSDGRVNAIGHSLNSCARIMSFGSDRHILCSGTFFSQFIDHSDFQNSFHPVGRFPDKHGYEYDVYNYYKDSMGNPTAPKLHPSA